MAFEIASCTEEALMDRTAIPGICTLYVFVDEPLLGFLPLPLLPPPLFPPPDEVGEVDAGRLGFTTTGAVEEGLSTVNVFVE